MTGFSAKRLQLVVKRIIDHVSAVALLILTSPLFLIIAVAIKLDSSGPIFFRQKRLGIQGRTFCIWKFRTMIPDAEKSGAGIMTYDKDPRITHIGHFLRKYRLDELPQLINVVVGDMSLVGPRPLLPQFLVHYSERDRRRLELPPGMTGWQQVRGGSLNSWEERVALDVWYVEHWNLWLDVKILILTIGVVVKADTVYGLDGRQLSGLPTTIHDEYLSSNSGAGNEKQASSVEDR